MDLPAWVEGLSLPYETVLHTLNLLTKLEDPKSTHTAIMISALEQHPIIRASRLTQCQQTDTPSIQNHQYDPVDIALSQNQQTQTDNIAPNQNARPADIVSIENHQSQSDNDTDSIQNQSDDDTESIQNHQTRSTQILTRRKSTRTANSLRGDKRVSTIRERPTKIKSMITKERNAKESRKQAIVEETDPFEQKWITSKKPPKITNEVIDLVTEIAAISSSLQRPAFIDFLESLKSPVNDEKFTYIPTDFKRSITNCKTYENRIAVDDFFHMFTLMQIAIQLERCFPKIFRERH